MVLQGGVPCCAVSKKSSRGRGWAVGRKKGDLGRKGDPGIHMQGI